MSDCAEITVARLKLKVECYWSKVKGRRSNVQDVQNSLLQISGI